MSRKNTSQRDSGRKARKPHHDDSDEMSLNSNLDWFADSGSQVPQDDGYRDLFGELIPPDECVSNEEAKNKSNKKTPRKRKQPRDDYFDTPTRPKRLFIPTKRFMIAMEEAKKELYELMGKTNSKKVSVVSTDSLNVSGVQHIQDSPQTSMNNGNNDNDKKSQQVFEGKLKCFINYR
ncbi:unnamed protein product [Macrosiphum euphorbiae]|uniref:Uncharacterized protein n=1 Tax=Macrosiphum euphorbiae TaxID=13131 RepID=A0AAV0Y5Y8_9HEMI|nr:unnamed protein product [Macrosiphum euphorbiae]